MLKEYSDNYNENAYQAYLNEINKYPILSLDEQKELAKQYQKGDMNARNKLIDSNLLFVVSVANQFNDQLDTLSPLDIIQEGNLGLIRAIETYDPEKGALTTYSHDWISRYIQNAIRDTNKNMKTSSSFNTNQKKYLRFIEKCKASNKPIPKDDEICKKLKIKKETLINIKNAKNFNVESLNRIINNETKDELQMFVKYNQKEYENIESEIDNVIFLLNLKRNLSLKDYFFLYYRFLADKKKTLDELASILLITGETVRKNEIKALEKAEKALKLENTYQEPIYLNECNIEKMNIYPIEPNDIIKYLFIKNILSKQERKMFYLKYILKNKYTKKEYCNYLNCSKEECETILTILNKKIITNFEDKEKYMNFKNTILKKYKTEIFNLFIKEIKEIEFLDLIEKFSQYSIEELIEKNPLTRGNQELLLDFFTKSKKKKPNFQENEIVYRILRKVEKNIKENEENIILSKK